MTDLRTAAQQALEALEEADTYHRNQPDQRSRRLAAMAALRAALAQQEEPDAYGYAARLAVAIWEKHYKDTAPQWKPLDYLIGVLTQIDNMTAGLTRQPDPVQKPGTPATVANLARDIHAAVLRRRESGREPVQEPVAWYFEARHIDSAWGAAVSLKHPGPEGVYTRNVKPLYTAPPRRAMVPLTAQQLDGVIERHVGGAEITDDEYASMEQFARAVEKASWEKNHGQA